LYAGITLATSFQPTNINTMPVAATEVRQGLYKEYTVERVDDSALDDARRGYKTAEETDENKNKVLIRFVSV
jgi:hypothetical protein